MECRGHVEIVYAFQFIEEKVMKGRIKESPWRSRKIVFGTSFINLHNNLLFCVIFRALHLAQPGLMAVWLADQIKVIFEIFKILYRSK